MKLNKTTIISSVFLALALSMPAASIQSTVQTFSDENIIPTRHSVDKIKSIELGSDSSTIVFDSQDTLHEDEVLTAGYDQAVWTSYDGLQTQDTSGMLGRGEPVKNNSYAQNIDFYNDQRGEGSDRTVNRMVVEQIDAGEIFSGAIVREWDEEYPDGILRGYMWGGDINNATIPELEPKSSSAKGVDDNQITKSYTTPVTIDLDGDGNDGMEVEGEISVGYDHAVAKAYDPNGNLNGGTPLPGQLFTWGNNDFRQTGADYVTGDLAAPSLIPDSYFGDLTPESGSDEIMFKDVEYGLRDSFAIVHNSNDDKDHLFAWGNNDKGQLGLSSDNIVAKPKEVVLPGFEGEMIKVVAAKQTTYLLTKDKDGVYDVWGWGTNDKQSLGTKKNGSVVSANERITPTKLDVVGNNSKDIGEDYKITGLYSNMLSSTVFVTMEDSNGMNHAMSWGDNSNGQMGQWGFGVQTSATPKELDVNNDGVLGTESKIKEISVGSDAVAAIYESKDGTQQQVYMWGNNTTGIFGWGDKNLNDKLTPSLVWTYQESKNNSSGLAFIQILSIVFMVLALILILATVLMYKLWMKARYE